MHFLRFYHISSVFTKMKLIDYKSFLREQFLKAVGTVNPSKLVEEAVKLENGKLRVQGNIYDVENVNFYLIGFGKAVLGMADQCEKILGSQLKKGVICVPVNMFQNRNEFGVRRNSVIQVYEGAENNMPDEKAEKGCEAAIELINSLNCENDNLIVLISGGGSALFPKPCEGLILEDVCETIALLTSSGANINELNTVRKRISKVKGGGLAELSYPTRTLTLILSDVINDPLEIIASGPTVPNLDEDTEPLDILKKYKLEGKIPRNILRAVQHGPSKSKVPIVNKRYPHVDNFVIGNNGMALNASKIHAQANSFETIIFSDSVNGLVGNVAQLYYQILFLVLKGFENGSVDVSAVENLVKKCSFKVKSTFVDELSKALKSKSNKICVICGGEVTVRVEGKGKGGRNQELALIMSKKIHQLRNNFQLFFEKYNILFFSAGTDGIDGPTDAAGAIGEAQVVDKALDLNLSVDEYLSKNDSYTFFTKFNCGSHLVKTGHTGTNVMDVHYFLIYETNTSSL